MEEKTTLSNSQIKSKAKEALKGNWGTAVITFIIFNIVMYSITYVYNINQISNYIQNPYLASENPSLGASGILFFIKLLLAGPMTYGITRFCMNLVRDKSHKIENIFEGFKYFGGTFIINIVLGIYRFLWSLLLFIPLFIIIFVVLMKEFSKTNMNFYSTGNDFNGWLVAIFILLVIVLTVALAMILFRYSMTYYIYIDNPDIGAMQAIKESVDIMKGNKTRLLLLYLSFILWYLLGIITLSIAFLWITPYVKSAEAVFYNELKRSNEYNVDKELSTL
ncbi:DUF975 family protein [Clostridium sporogenes]|uniref:DUF975 family protein n=1 Tax=Clostridium sporogenes TaxID=1509 RepID=UPI0013D000E5|nr:DUF975 family protein [Clostridium sporogenes]NFV12024.1 DUF975 family protein [Clostridium sporogenes]